MSLEQKLNLIRNAIKSSNYLVCLQGMHISEDCGCLNYQSDKDAYRIETKYGYSPEEMFSSVFYNNRPHQFFAFYREEMLKKQGNPDASLYTLAQMERDGILKTILTREIFSLAKRAGCERVLECHGNIYQNKCPRCGQMFPLEYMIHAQGIPICHKCDIPIHPQVRLMGEMVDNQVVSRATDEVTKADVLLVAGCNLKANICQNSLRFFKGDTIILINEKPHYSDQMANLVYHGKPKDIMPLLYP